MAGSIEVTWCVTDIWSPGNNNQHSQCTIDMPWIFFFPLHCTPNIYLNRSHRVPMILKTFTSNGIKWASYTRIFKGKQNQKTSHFWEMIKKIQKCIISLSGFSQDSTERERERERERETAGGVNTVPLCMVCGKGWKRGKWRREIERVKQFDSQV